MVAIAFQFVERQDEYKGFNRRRGNNRYECRTTVAFLQHLARPTSAEVEDDMPKEKRIFRISSNNKGLLCPFKPSLCQEGYCAESKGGKTNS